MKILTFVARFVLGAVFLIFGLNFFLQFLPMPTPEGKAGQFMGALMSSGYLLQTTKVVEILSGVLLFANRYVPLALVLLAPIIVNIVLFHVFLTPPATWALALGILAAELFLMWRYRAAYGPLFVPKAVAA